MIAAALSGVLEGVSFEKDPVLNLEIPATCPGVPAEVLKPRSTWPDGAEYDAAAVKLARMFADNFAAFAAGAGPEVVAAGPRA